MHDIKLIRKNPEIFDMALEKEVKAQKVQKLLH